MTRRGVGYRIGQWSCWAIGAECLGGVAYYAVRAGQLLSVMAFAALGILARLGIHAVTRRR